MVRVMVCFVLLCIVFNFFGFLIGANKADNVRGIIVFILKYHIMVQSTPSNTYCY